METKTVKSHEVKGFGFKVTLLNAPMIKLQGEWVLNIGSEKLQKVVAFTLVHKPTRLSGNEIHYIRQFFKMTTTSFGQKFDVSHAAVLKWEKAGDKSTEMNWSTEKDIRLFILSKLKANATQFMSLYNGLEEKAEDIGKEPLVIDAKDTKKVA